MNQTDFKVSYPIVAGLSVFLVLVYLARDVLAPFAIAYSLAYLFDPLVDKIESRKFSRTFSIIVLLIGFFGLIFFASILLIPLLQLQVHQLVDNLPGYIGKMQGWIKPLLDQISGLNVARLQQLINEGMEKFGQLPMKIVSSTSKFIWSSISGLLNIFMVIFNLIIIPVVMFYLLRDFDSINTKILNLIPPKYRKKALELVADIDQVISKFVRGQLMVATLMAGLYIVGLYLSGTPLSLFIGIAAGYANLVPYLGLVIGFIPALILTFLQHPEWSHLLGVLVTFGAVQTLEGMVITPRVVGEEIGLHPVVVILAVMIGAKFFGILGIVIAVPATAVLNILFIRGFKVYQESSFYK